MAVTATVACRGATGAPAFNRITINPEVTLEGIFQVLVLQMSFLRMARCGPKGRCCWAIFQWVETRCSLRNGYLQL